MAKKSTPFTALLIFLCFSTFFLHTLSRTTPLNTATATASASPAASGLDNAQSADDDDWWGNFPFPPIWPFVPAPPSPPAAGHDTPPPPKTGGDDWWGHFPFPPVWPFVPSSPSPPAGAKNPPPAPSTNPAPPASSTTPKPPGNGGDDWWGHFPFPPIWPFVPAPPSPPAKEKVDNTAKTSPPAA